MAEAVGPIASGPQQGGPLTFQVLRQDDLLTLQFEAYNMHLDVTDPSAPKLAVTNAKAHAYLVVRFPPQTILEQTYFEAAPNVATGLPTGTESPPPAGSVQRRMAGTSRLAFRLPAAMKAIPYRLDALLDWSRLELMLSPTALGHSAAGPLPPPATLETAIEMPFRLIISPTGPVGWAHATESKTHAGRTELWHTRLTREVTVQQHGHAVPRSQELSPRSTTPLRAIWSTDYVDHRALPPASFDEPFEAAMSPRDRAQIVVLTSGFTGYYVPGGVTALPWVPVPVQAERLFLSPLGGWLTSHGSWPSPPSYAPSTDSGIQSLDLVEWRHLATQGRDHYVKIVTEGFLYPFGHRAALVKVTERKVAPGAFGEPVAYLRQHEYVAVREREKAYSPSDFTFGGREMPFLRSVRLETAVTPDIDKPTYLYAGSPSFWIRVGGEDLRFHVRAVDAAGAHIDLLARMIFVSVGEGSIDAVASAYRGSPDQPCPVDGRKVAYVDPAQGDTTLRTTSLTFDTQIVQHVPPYPLAPFLPMLAGASITVPALERLTGQTDPVAIKFYEGYLTAGIDLFAGVFARIDQSPAPSIVFSADHAGGFATPNIMLTALSAHKGVVAGPPEDAAAGLIDPASYFGGLTFPGKIFGTVPLSELIKLPAGKTKADAGPNAPTIRTSLRPDAHAPKTSVVSVHWSPDLTDYSVDPVKIEFNQDGTSALTIDAVLQRSLTGGPPSSEITGALTHFRLSLLGVIALRIESIKFVSKNGAKPDVKATLTKDSPVVFEGALAFVQALASIMPPGIFGGKGPSIDLTPTGLHVSYTLSFPSVSCGVFALEHISITVGLKLPYVDGKPSFEFSFAKRSSPFLLTIECLGGGGFVGLVVDADGVQLVEGALEFGAEMSFDIGIGSGGVHIMAGIYFQLSSKATELTGFVDIGGELSIFGGLISVSIDLNLSLTYHHENNKDQVTGRATLTISVHIIFFSIHVSMSIEKSFGKDPRDPKVGQVISGDDWAAYAAAFA